MIKSYRDLKVWQAAMDFADSVYKLTRRFPRDERFGLTSQLQRSAVSVASNIAEGHERGTTPDYLRFLAIARGSLAESETQLLLAERLSYVTSLETSSLLGKADEIGRMLRTLQRVLRRRT